MNSSDKFVEKIKILDLIDLKFLQNIQDFFANTMGIASLIIDDNGHVTQPSNFIGFCNNLVRCCDKTNRECNNCDLKWGKVAAKRRSPVIYTCHAGLKDFVVPIMLDSIHIASIYGGQVLTNPLEQKKIIEFAKKRGMDEAVYLPEIEKINIVSQQTLEAACDLLYHVANSISGIMYANIKLSKMGIDYKLYRPILMENIFFSNGGKELKPLTQREFEVLKLIVTGKNNNEIAKDLFISVHTVKAHVSTILEKMGVQDRVQVAVKAVREGLVS